MNENIKSGEEVILMLMREEITRDQAVTYLAHIESISIEDADAIIRDTFQEEQPIAEIDQGYKGHHDVIDDPYEIVLTFTPQEWQPLMDILHRLEDREDLSTEDAGWWSQPKIVMDFKAACDQVGILIPFDWVSWSKNYEPDLATYFNKEPISILEASKYFTALIRAERTTEGLISSEFSNGTILRLLKIIQAEINS